MYKRIIPVLLAFLYVVPPALPQVEKRIDSDSSVVLKDYDEIYLSVVPEEGEGYIHLAGEFTDSENNWRRLREINRDRSPVKGKNYFIPYPLLRKEYRLLVIETLFPEDRYDGNDWIHVVSGYSLDSSENLWRIAEWFTGNGSNYKRLAAHNGFRDYSIRRGQEIKIPGTILDPAFVVKSYKPAPGSELEFGKDAKGEYAMYRLKQGEALYSAVVVRFTGLLEAEEVIATAMQIAERSNITDVTDIPVGYPVKIPRDLLLPEHLPPSDPRRREFESIRERAASYRIETRSLNLDGVHVILDPGHGGIDRGACIHGVWEDDYVYDIMCRIKRILERETGARVHTTMIDKSSGYTVFEREKLDMDTDEYILTDPPFYMRKPGDSIAGVNFRWYKSNYLCGQLRARGVDEDKIVFTSIHADSLHRSVRGAMIYVPGTKYAESKFGKNGSTYMKRKEVKAAPYYSVSYSSKRKSEGLSYNLADLLLTSLRRERIGIHPYRPVRDHVVRRRSAWLPAVLRYNIVSTKLLLEVCNLNNTGDAALMKTPAFRERVARAYVNALLEYYS